MSIALFNRILALPLAAHAGALIVSIVGFNWVKGKLDASYAASRHPVDYATGQTSFSGDAIKGWYKVMTDAGTLDIHRQTQLIDFGFIAGMIAIGLFGGLLLARAWRSGSLARKAALFTATIVPAGALFDAAENVVSFVMLANPADFANWIALPYSALASLKFACITMGMAGVLVSLLAGAVGRILNKPKFG